MRLEINMTEFVEITKKFFNEKDIKNIIEIGSLNGNDALFFKTSSQNQMCTVLKGYQIIIIPI